MGTFAVNAVVEEIDQRLGNTGVRARKALKEDEASDEFVELLATAELINRYAASELLSTGPPREGRATPKSLSDEVIARLKKWVAQIREAVLKLASALHADSWSITVAFPWSILITLDFKIPA